MIDNVVKRKIDKAVNDVLLIEKNISEGSIPYILYYSLFGSSPDYIYKTNKSHLMRVRIPYNEEDDIKYSDDIDIEKFHKVLMDKYEAYHTNIAYDDIYILYDKKVICMLHDLFIKVITDINAFDNEQEIEDFVKSIQNDIEKYNGENDDKVEVGILSRRNSGYYVESHFIDKRNVDVNKIYNDDLPVERIDDFISSDETGLILFYGEPGTGKTTYIRNLIEKHDEKEFIILDSNILVDITSNSLLSEFINHNDAIWVLEDCEKLLVSRDDSQNPIISAFLNMSDGILAEVIKCKFICTFNTSIENIDNALTRKGRMKLKYKFNKLDKNKAKKINPSVTEDITMADLFYMNKENDFSKNNRKKIGF